MKYPMATTTLLYQRQEDGRFCVTDSITQNSAIVTPEIVRFLHRLDGKTDPYTISTELTRREIDVCLADLLDLGFLRTSRVFLKSLGTFVYTLWTPKSNAKIKAVAYFFDWALKRAWFPALAFGAILFGVRCEDVFDNMDMSILASVMGWIVGVITGVVLHELSHGFTAMANGVKVFEGGILIFLLLPGAYVAINDEKLKDLGKKVRIYSSGIQMNLLLAGIGALVAVLFGTLNGFWIEYSVANLLMGMSNCLFIKGFDGYKILISLLGKTDEKLFPSAFTTKKHDGVKKRRAASTLANTILFVWQLVLPIIIFYNILFVAVILR